MILILGYGRTGQAVAKFLREKNEDYCVYDDGINWKVDPVINKINHIPWHRIKRIITSPGVCNWPKLHPVVEQARELLIPIYSDMDLLYGNNVKSRFIGITGSQGKSTIHDFLNKLMERANMDYAAGGNNGIGVMSLPSNKKNYLLEVSMQQLSICHSIIFDIVVINNIYDTHQEFGNLIYRHYCKSKILLGSSYRQQYFIIADYPKGLIHKFQDDLDWNHVIVVMNSKKHSVNDLLKYKNWVFTDITQSNNKINYEILGKSGSVVIDKSISYNIIASENIEVVLAASKLLSIEEKDFLQTLNEYSTLSDRCELVHTHKTSHHKVVNYYNCSKCTNSFAFQGLSEYIMNKIIDKNSANVFMIGGILNSPLDYLNHPILHLLHKIVVYGQDREQIYNYILSLKIEKNRIIECDTLKNALEILHKNHDHSLLNYKFCNLFLIPACQSFDEFTDYINRASIFTQQVKSLSKCCS